MFREIRKLYKQGYRNIVGVDEAGRGPLAGPVVAVAVAMTNRNLVSSWKLSFLTLGKIRDSKKLSEKQREKWYKILTTHPDLEWAVASVSHKVIDKINILEATKLAMRRAVQKLQKQLDKPIDCLVIDGGFTINSVCHSERSEAKRRISPALMKFLISCPGRARSFGLCPQDDKNITPYQKAIPKADETVFLCMAASIIAKVTRDRIMRRLHKKYPQYGFDKHKGYGTEKHLRILRKHGPCEIHRKTFRPLRGIVSV